MKKVLVLLISVLIWGLTYGQVESSKSANQILEERGEVYFKFTVVDDENIKKNINQLSRIISIDKVVGNEVTAYANTSEFNSFTKLNIDYTVLIPPSMLIELAGKNKSATGNVNDWDYYPTYSEYIDMMNQFAIDYPNLCEVVNIGSSVQDRDLLFIHINSDLNTTDGDPEFMYTSSMHGDEITGYVLLLRYIDYLLQNYGTDPEVTNLVNNIDIWINPLANPDGTYATGNNSVYGATRTNANNVDLNRNYADPDDGPHPDGNAYQIETIAFMDFAEERSFVMSSNFHGGAEVVNYPWDTYSQLAPDDDWWVLVCREYADIAQANSPAGYLTYLNNGITNGYAWYAVSGGRQDYMNYFHNCREMTLEISDVKLPPASQLPDFWEYNYRSFNKYMEQVLFGFKGIVTNAANGNTIEAKVFVDNHDDLNSWVFSHQPLGNYFRPIDAGTYDVTFSAFGYYDKTINDIVISDYSVLELNVELDPYTSLTAGFTSSATVVSAGSSVDYFDNSWGNDIISWLWTFEGGEPATSSEQNPVGIVYNDTGDFDVSLTVSNMNGESDTKLMEEYINVNESYNMTNGSITTCNALFLDSGGDNNYSDNEELIMTFLPQTPNSSIKMEFIEFNVENHFNCGYDYLEVYNGSDINAPLIGKWCGTNSPGSIIATNDEGALTAYFYSDSGVNLSGWKALVTCDSNVGINDIKTSEVLIFPNPAKSQIQISADNKISNIILTDLRGRTLYSAQVSSGVHTIDVADFERGIYLLSFTYNSEIITRKIVLN